MNGPSSGGHPMTSANGIPVAAAIPIPDLSTDTDTPIVPAQLIPGSNDGGSQQQQQQQQQREVVHVEEEIQEPQQPRATRAQGRRVRDKLRAAGLAQDERLAATIAARAATVAKHGLRQPSSKQTSTQDEENGITQDEESEITQAEENEITQAEENNPEEGYTSNQPGTEAPSEAAPESARNGTPTTTAVTTNGVDITRPAPSANNQTLPIPIPGISPSPGDNTCNDRLQQNYTVGRQLSLGKYCWVVMTAVLLILVIVAATTITMMTDAGSSDVDDGINLDDTQVEGSPTSVDRHIDAPPTHTNNPAAPALAAHLPSDNPAAPALATHVPSDNPAALALATHVPLDNPSHNPSLAPTSGSNPSLPTEVPTTSTTSTSVEQSLMPTTSHQSIAPSSEPSTAPTSSSITPSQQPTITPSQQPTLLPTHEPAMAPTMLPSQPTTDMPQTVTTITPTTLTPTANVFPNNLPSQTRIALQDPASPQSRALRFVTSYPGYRVNMPEWRKEQLFAMATFYYSYNGDDWQFIASQENWLSTAVSECMWGVQGDYATVCNDKGEVTYMALDNQRDTLRGTTPPEMSLLSSLEGFEMLNNHWFTSVEQILPSEMAQMSSLADVQLRNNDMTGVLPSSLGEFTSLTNLNLRDNSFSGQIPTQLGLLTNLKSLILHGNSLTGTIPTELAQITSLEFLGAHENDIAGTVPTELCTLPLLRNLRLDCNVKVVCPPECNNCICEDGQGETQPPSPLFPTAAPGPQIDAHSFDPSVDDPEWPGAYPTPSNSLNTITINVRTNQFPNETKWEWSKWSTGTTYTVVDSRYNLLLAETLYFFTQAVDSNSRYRLIIRNGPSHGTCCSFGFSWFTITNSTTSSNNPEGTVIWSATGVLDSDLGVQVNVLEAHILINAQGQAILAQSD